MNDPVAEIMRLAQEVARLQYADGYRNALLVDKPLGTEAKQAFALAALESFARSVVKDAERYRWLREKTSGGHSLPGSPAAFFLPSIATPRGVDIMRGSVAQHLDKAIDEASA